MPRYIEGFYLGEDDTHLEQIRKVYDALEDLYPWGGNEFVISEKSNVALGTCRGYLKQKVGELAKFTRKEKRDKGTKLSGPGKNRFNVENYSFVLNKEKQSAKAFSPGYVNYKQDFLDGWNKIIKKSEVDVIHETLVKFLGDIFDRMDLIANDPTVGKIKPRLGEVTTQQKVTETGDPIEKTKDMICNGCGINHEARDFIRAILLHLADLLELNKKYIKFLSEKNFLNEAARNTYLKIAEGEPIKAQVTTKKVGIPFFIGEQIEYRRLVDVPQSLLTKIYELDENKYDKIVKYYEGKYISRDPSFFDVTPRKIPKGYFLRVKMDEGKIWKFCQDIVTLSGFPRSDWRVEY